MNWFKHDTGASNDAKIKRLVIKYGAEGYAIYFHCLELIAADVKETNVSFALDHSPEMIADNLKIRGDRRQSAAARVEEIIRYLVELELFECENNVVTCYKIAKRLDQSMTNNSKMRELIANFHCHDVSSSVMTRHDMSWRREEKREDKKRGEAPRKVISEEEL